MEELVNQLTQFIHANQEWTGLILGLMTMGESLLIVGIAIPATAIMLVVGGLIGSGTVEPKKSSGAGTALFLQVRHAVDFRRPLSRTVACDHSDRGRCHENASLALSGGEHPLGHRMGSGHADSRLPDRTQHRRIRVGWRQRQYHHQYRAIGCHCDCDYAGRHSQTPHSPYQSINCTKQIP